MKAPLLIISAIAYLLATSNHAKIWVDAQPDIEKGESSQSERLSLEASRSISIPNYRSSRAGSSMSIDHSPGSVHHVSPSPYKDAGDWPASYLPASDRSGLRSRGVNIGSSSVSLPESLEGIMDLHCEPCDDFTRFATGLGSIANWPSIIQRNLIQTSELIQTSNETSSRLQKGPAEIMSKNIRWLYRSCMQRVESIDQNRMRFLSLMADLGSCPLLQEELGWDIRQGDSNLRFVTSMLRLFKMGLMKRQPISLDVVPDPEDPSRPILHIGQPKEFMYLDRGIKDHSIYDRLQYLRPRPLQDDMIREVQVFAAGLSKLIDNGKQQPKKVNLGEFAKDHPEIDWIHLVRGLTGQSGSSYILISNEKYLSLFGKLLVTSSEGLIPNYIFINLFQRFEGYIFDKLGHGFNKTHCLAIVHTELPLPLAIEHKRSKDHRRLYATLIEVNHLAEKVRSRVRESLKRSNWMTTESRDHALDKLNKMKFFIALTTSDEFEWDVNLAQEQYGGYQLEENFGFVQNYLLVREKLASFKLAQLRKPTRNAAEWSKLYFKTSLRVDYVKEANIVEIPLAVLEAPLFDIDQPDYLNYGALGYMLAKSVLKAFSLHASHYDSKGVYVKEMFDEPTRSKFMHKTQTFLLHRLMPRAEAERTLTIDISYLGAARIALAAYENRLSTRTQPADSSSILANGQWLSPRQLFLVALAANMASVREQLPGGTNPTGTSILPERINHIFKHIRQFTDLFNCRVGSYMKLVADFELDIW